MVLIATLAITGDGSMAWAESVTFSALMNQNSFAWREAERAVSEREFEHTHVL